MPSNLKETLGSGFSFLAFSEMCNLVMLIGLLATTIGIWSKLEWVGDVFVSLLNKCGLTITWAFCFLYEKAETFDKNCQRQHAFYCTWWNSLPTHVYSDAITSRQSLRSTFWNHKRTHCLGKLLPKLLWVKCCLGPYPQRGESSARVARTQILVYIYIYIYITG